MSRILIINGSPRKDGVDSNIAKAISERLTSKGQTVEIIDVYDLRISGCRACMSCKKTGKCAIDDDMMPVYDKIKSSDMLIFLSPIYFGSETGQLKLLIDRLFATTGAERPLGSVKMSSVLLTCGDPMGNMTYGSNLMKFSNAMKYLKVEDFASGCILGGLKPEDVATSSKVDDYIESLEFQLGI